MDYREGGVFGIVVVYVRCWVRFYSNRYFELIVRYVALVLDEVFIYIFFRLCSRCFLGVGFVFGFVLETGWEVERVVYVLGFFLRR